VCQHHEAIDYSRPFLEGTIPNTKAYRTSMKQVREAVSEMFETILPQVNRSIAAASMNDENRTLDIRHRDRVLREVGELVQGLFVADGRFAFAADGVTARSPFAQLLNTFYVRVTIEAVYSQHEWLKKKIPTDVFQFLSRAKPLNLGEAENPFLRRDGESDEAFRQRLKDLRIFEPNPLLQLDPNRQWVPIHKWKDANGYQLDRRIWNNSLSSRSDIDDMISAAFDEGMGALELARILEAALLPGMDAIRTDKPYGVDVSFYAMRLAQTEIARAANHAAYISAYLNPYVDKIDVARSPNGSRECPICPQFATLGFGGERLREPYSIHAANIPPFHPYCKDHVRSVVTDSPSTVTNRLRAVMEDSYAANFPPSVNPAAADAMLQTLLHRSLNTIVAQFRGQFALPGF
jgi:hypothetical protein